MSIETTMLVKVDAGANNNKFYELRLDGSTVHKRWGRVGADGQKGVEQTGRAGFDKLIKAKIRKGYTEVKVAGSTGPTSSATKDEVRDISRRSLAVDPTDTAIAELIDRLVERNAHEIIKASGGMITVNADGVMETPLGIIEQDAIREARAILEALEASKTKDSAYKSRLEEYLRLVPQKLPHTRGWEQTFFDDHPAADQREFLDQLEKSHEWYEAEREAAKSKDDTVDYSDFFRYRLRLLGREGEDRETFRRINKFYRDHINRKHHSDVANKKLHAVYVLENSDADEAIFRAHVDVDGNVQEAWHGTNVVNLLSILRQGFFVPPVNSTTIQIAGRMFGPGVYLSRQSSKSLRYSSGAWHGTKETDLFMFLNEAVCGKMYQPSHHSQWSQAHKGGYHSINVEPGTGGVLNHELIVWDTTRVMPRYLCEFR